MTVWTKPEEFLAGIKGNVLERLKEDNPYRKRYGNWDDDAILAAIRERDARQRAEGHAEGCRETIEQVREMIVTYIDTCNLGWGHSVAFDHILAELDKLRRELEE